MKVLRRVIERSLRIASKSACRWKNASVDLSKVKKFQLIVFMPKNIFSYFCLRWQPVLLFERFFSQIEVQAILLFMTFVHTNERLYKNRRIIHCDTVTSQHIYDVIDNNRKSKVNDFNFCRKPVQIFSTTL